MVGEEEGIYGTICVFSWGRHEVRVPVLVLAVPLTCPETWDKLAAPTRFLVDPFVGEVGMGCPRRPFILWSQALSVPSRALHCPPWWDQEVAIPCGVVTLSCLTPAGPPAGPRPACFGQESNTDLILAPSLL
jgi:hypothetical protein